MTSVSRLASSPSTATVAVIAALAGALLVLSAWIAPAPVRAAELAVDISGFAFNPGSVTVQVGDTVTWTNNEVDVSHTATSDAAAPAAFDSGSMAPSGTFSFDFTEPGSYAYSCSIHPDMTGSIVVEAAAAATPTPAASQLPDGATAPAGTSGQGSSLLLGLLLIGLGGFALVLRRLRQPA